MQARKIKVTVSTYEVEDGEDFAMKTKIETELLEEDKRPLADSNIEQNAIEHHNWMKDAKKTARYNVLQGITSSLSHTYFIVDDEKERELKGLKPKESTPSGDAEMNLQQLRSKYPDIKATSVRVFLERVNELHQDGKEA